MAHELGSPQQRHRAGRRAVVLGVVGALLVGLAVIVVWFEPQTLLIDDRVDEDLPGLVAPAATTVDPVTASSEEVPDPAPAPTTAPPAPTTEPPARPATLDDHRSAAAATGAPQVVSSGSFIGLDHGTTGTALVVALPDGSTVVRFEGLDTSNGPDLHVVLTPHAPDSGSYDGRLELGRLKGNVGDQNYEVPSDVDLGRYRSVVIWCERFSSPFGAAPIAVPIS